MKRKTDLVRGPSRHASMMLGLLAVLAACEPGAGRGDRSLAPDGGGAGGASDPDAAPSDAPVFDPPVLGRWSGTATVRGGDRLADGDFPAALTLAQSGSRLRGFLDVRQDAAFLAESFGYLIDGEITPSGVLSLEATDRICGAGDPETLCNPTGEIRRVFEIHGRLDGEEIVLDDVAVLPDVSYPAGVAVEPPFELLRVSRGASSYSGEPRALAGAWSGPLAMPETMFVVEPLPLHGADDLVIEASGGGVHIARLDNEIAGNIVPEFDDVVLPDSLAQERASGRGWFIQQATSDHRWLYSFRRSGNVLSGIVAFDMYDAPRYAEDADPLDPSEIPLRDTVAVFNLFRAGE